jgi:hypothetical protein
MELDELVADVLHIIQHEGPVQMCREICTRCHGLRLAWCHAGGCRAFFSKFGDLIGQFVTGFAGELLLRFFDFFAEFDDGFFEFENLFHGQGKGWVGWLIG